MIVHIMYKHVCVECLRSLAARRRCFSQLSAPIKRSDQGKHTESRRPRVPSGSYICPLHDAKHGIGVSEAANFPENASVRETGSISEGSEPQLCRTNNNVF